MNWKVAPWTLIEPHSGQESRKEISIRLVLNNSLSGSSEKEKEQIDYEDQNRKERVFHDEGWRENSRRMEERIVDQKHNRTDGKEEGMMCFFQMTMTTIGEILTEGV